MPEVPTISPSLLKSGTLEVMRHSIPPALRVTSFHLIQDGFSGIEYILIILNKGARDFGRENIPVGAPDEIFGLSADQVTECAIDENEAALTVLDPEEDVRKGLKKAQRDLPRAQPAHEGLKFLTKSMQRLDLLLQIRRSSGNPLLRILVK